MIVSFVFGSDMGFCSEPRLASTTVPDRAGLFDVLDRHRHSGMLAPEPFQISRSPILRKGVPLSHGAPS